MRNPLLFLASTALAGTIIPSLYSQSTTFISNVGYRQGIYPQPVAPGQVVTLFVRGFSVDKAVQAAAIPLPTTLAGVSVTLQEPLTGDNSQLPVLSVTPSGCGYGLKYVCDMVAVTVQIPTDLHPCVLGPNGCQAVARPVVNVAVNGAKGFQTELQYQATNIHILNSCDVIAAQGVPCQGVVTHANGVLVSDSNPAHPSEELVVYAVGLGVTNPSIPTGQTATSATPVADLLGFNVQYSSVPTSPPYATPPPPQFVVSAKPIFAGLTPGYVGLYQVNVAIPPQLPLQACSGAGNVQLTLETSNSSDNSIICVQPN